ncbi:Elongator complex protein, partial [Phytophthora palmivora]
MEQALAHVAVGCNAATNALSVAVNGSSLPPVGGNYCGAFAAKNVVCLLSSSVDNETLSSPLKIVETLKHQETTTDVTRLTSVRLQSDGQSGDVRVLAGDSEGRVFLWSKVDGLWKVRKVSEDQYKLPTVAVAAVATAVTDRHQIYVATFSDGTLAVFGQSLEEDEVKLLSRLELGVKTIMEAVDVTVINGGESVLVAAGGVDGKVHLFELTGDDKLTKVLELEGHRG